MTFLFQEFLARSLRRLVPYERRIGIDSGKTNTLLLFQTPPEICHYICIGIYRETQSERERESTHTQTFKSLPPGSYPSRYVSLQYMLVYVVLSISHKQDIALGWLKKGLRGQVGRRRPMWRSLSFMLYVGSISALDFPQIGFCFVLAPTRSRHILALLWS